MRYIIALMTCSILFVQCRPEIDVYPTGSYDTLGIRWMTIERDNIMYYFQGNGKEGASIFTDMHEEAYVQLNPVFDARLPQKLRFFIWTDWEQAQHLLGHFPGFAIPEECVCHIRANQTLGHEMTHILSYWADGVEPTNYSRFIVEGVAVAFDLNENDKIETAKEAIAGYNVESISDFWGGSFENAPEDLLYPVAGAFVQYLYQLNQPEQFKALLKHQTIEDAAQIYGQERLTTIIGEFDKLLGL